MANSCHNENPVEYTGKFKINQINSDTLSYGDTLSIIGEFFGKASIDKEVFFDSLNIIKSTECLMWNMSEIRLVIPTKSESGYIKFFEKNILLDSVYIGINPVPKIDTVEVKSGKYIRGSESSSINEMPAKEITISNTLIVSKYEITQRVFETVSGENPSRTVALELPVENVSWISAIEFCNTLSILNGLEPVYKITGLDITYEADKNGWRLPTEAEWEYICRAGTDGDFSGTGNIDNMGWYGNNSGLQLHPVGSKQANAFGVYDIHGNVWEWCWDFYDDNYYSSSPDIDPKGPKSGVRRVIRGGSWNDGINFARSSNRSIPENLNGNIGFRIVRNK
jgi:formylglycine-generating enzyme required for sulfatase activity